MSLPTLMNGFESFVTVYFAVVAVTSAAVALVGIRALVEHSRRRSATALADLVANDYCDAVSILVPAYNEERTIVASIRSMLNLQHPMFDVIVANDGSTDATLDELIANFSLVEVPIAHDETITTEPLRRMFRSVDHANLTVLDKEYGGRSDALNAALNLARRPLVCVAPNDARFEPRALVWTSRAFVEDERVVAVCGTVRPVNAAEPGARSWVERVELVRFARNRLVAAAGWARMGGLTSTSGFAMFRRQALVAVGGWWTSTAADDADIAIRLHRHYRESGSPYRIAFAPEEICWTNRTSTLGGLLRSRNDRARAVLESLRQHLRVVGNRRYGFTGLAAMPYRWLVAVCSPVVETAAYAYIVASAAFGRLDVPFAVTFFALTMGYGFVSAQLSTGAESLVAPHHTRLRDRIALIVASIAEQVVLRPILVVVRLATLPDFSRRVEVVKRPSSKASSPSVGIGAAS